MCLAMMILYYVIIDSIFKSDMMNKCVCFVIMNAMMY